MHAGCPISDRSLLEPFKVGVAVIDGLGEKKSGHISYDGSQNLALDLATTDATDAAGKDSVRNGVERAIGVLETGELATLKNLSLTKHRCGRGKYHAVTSSYAVGEMFVGKDVFDADKFDLISVKFKGLLEWMDRRPLKTTDLAADKFSVKYTKPRIPAVALDDGSTLEVVFLYTRESSSVPAEKFTLPQSTAFNIRTKTPIPFKPLYYKALQFNRLIMLFTNTFMPLTSIQVRAGGDMFGVFGRYRTYRATDKINYFEFNSHYTDMLGDFAGAVNGWFELYGRHKASLNLHFNTWAQKNRMSLDVWFLRTVQSLEAFDKENKPDRESPGGRSKSRYKNRQSKRSLKKRLESLLEIPYRILETGTTEAEFIAYVKWVRDNYSHGDIQDPENLRRYAADLAENAKKLELLMHGNVIHELPIPDSVKCKIMESKVRQLDQFVESNAAE